MDCGVDFAPAQYGMSAAGIADKGLFGKFVQWAKCVPSFQQVESGRQLGAGVAASGGTFSGLFGYVERAGGRQPHPDAQPRTGKPSQGSIPKSSAGPAKTKTQSQTSLSIPETAHPATGTSILTTNFTSEELLSNALFQCWTVLKPCSSDLKSPPKTGKLGTSSDSLSIASKFSEKRKKVVELFTG